MENEAWRRINQLSAGPAAPSEKRPAVSFCREILRLLGCMRPYALSELEGLSRKLQEKDVATTFPSTSCAFCHAPVIAEFASTITSRPCHRCDAGEAASPSSGFTSSARPILGRAAFRYTAASRSVGAVLGPTSMRVRQALFLVGGQGTRLGAITANTPKPLLEIAPGLRFLDVLLEQAARHGFTNIVLLAGHLGEQVEASLSRAAECATRRSTVVRESVPAGTGGALALAQESARSVVPDGQWRHAVRHQSAPIGSWPARRVRRSLGLAGVAGCLALSALVRLAG